MSSLLQGLRAIREGREPLVGTNHAEPVSRQRPQINFVTVDPDEHQRKVQAERVALLREREIEERAVARLKAEADAQSRKQNGEPKAKPPGRPLRVTTQPLRQNSDEAVETARTDLLSNLTKSSPAHAAKPTQPQPERNRYAHLHENAIRVWFYVAEHSGEPLAMTQIAEALGLTVSEVSHRLRQLENNGILRRGLDGVIVVGAQPLA